MMKGEQIRLLEVNSVSLEKDYHGMGIGKQIYNHIIAGWKKQTRKPFVIIPEKCSVSGSTSKMARHLTCRSRNTTLLRNNNKRLSCLLLPSSNYVIVDLFSDAHTMIVFFKTDRIDF